MNVIFLDIDGPMISMGDLAIRPKTAIDRQFDPQKIKMLNLMLELTDSFLCINSTHNIIKREDKFSIIDDLIAAGVPPLRFYKIPTTSYPQVNRFDAITETVDGEDIKWVAIDDAWFLPEDDDRLVRVNNAYGIGYPELWNVCAFFNVKPPLVLM